MPEKKIVPGEMEDIDVDYISLVKKVQINRKLLSTKKILSSWKKKKSLWKRVFLNM